MSEVIIFVSAVKNKSPWFSSSKLKRAQSRVFNRFNVILCVWSELSSMWASLSCLTLELRSTQLIIRFYSDDSLNMSAKHFPLPVAHCCCSSAAFFAFLSSGRGRWLPTSHSGSSFPSQSPSACSGGFCSQCEEPLSARGQDLGVWSICGECECVHSVHFRVWFLFLTAGMEADYLCFHFSYSILLLCSLPHLLLTFFSTLLSFSFFFWPPVLSVILNLN